MGVGGLGAAAHGSGPELDLDAALGARGCDAAEPASPAAASGSLGNPSLAQHAALASVAAGERTIGLGERGAHIGALHQALLRAPVSTVDDTATALGAEAEQGVFGRGTERELSAWQRDHGLPTTGVLDPATLAALDQAIGAEPFIEAGRRGQGWANADDDTRFSVQRGHDGNLAEMPDHAASARENLKSAAKGILYSLPGVGLVGGLMESTNEHGGPSLKKSLYGVPGMGIPLALKDLADAAAHGLAHLKSERDEQE